MSHLCTNQQVHVLTKLLYRTACGQIEALYPVRAQLVCDIHVYISLFGMQHHPWV